MLNGLAGALVTLSALSAWALRPVDAVHGGSYVDSAIFSTSPFRGAVFSGGGSGIVLFVDGNEAVILTVAHGFDLSAKTGQQAMDEKTYRLASQSTSDGLATPAASRSSSGTWASGGASFTTTLRGARSPTPPGTAARSTTPTDATGSAPTSTWR